MSGPASKINIPLYSVTPLSCNHIIVSGGGGSANTGVFNGFAICEVTYEKNGYVAYELQRHETGSSAIMNTSLVSVKNGKRIFLAAGNDSDCYVYQIKLHPKSTDVKANGEMDLRNRNKKLSDLNDDEQCSKTILPDLTFDIQTILTVKTDFSQKDPYQNAVVFSNDARLLVTGGNDGYLRVWNFPEMKERLSMHVSKKEVSSLDITVDKKFISSVDKEGKCKIWNTSDGKMECSLDLPPEDDGKFLYKRCCFGVVENKRNTYRLFTILNPVNYKKNRAYLQHWTGPTFELTKVVSAGELLSALAVSHCGRYLAVGSMTNGDVDLYISFSLQRIKHVEKAHKTFVTGLAFLPPGQTNEGSVLADCDAAVASISIDNKILIHHVEKTSGISMWLAVVLIILVLLGTFILCSWLDL